LTFIGKGNILIIKFESRGEMSDEFSSAKKRLFWRIWREFRAASIAGSA
jgi:hypothetical protein